jgi:hypothetical protein
VNQHLAKERKETDALKREALQLGILIPRDPGWWWIDDEVARDVSSEMWELIGSDYEYLTDFGKAGTRRLIRDERRKLKDEARQDAAWERQQKQWTWTKWGFVISWVFTALAILIAIFKKR